MEFIKTRVAKDSKKVEAKSNFSLSAFQKINSKLKLWVLGPDADKLIARFKQNRGASFGMYLVLFFIAVAALAPLLAPHDPIGQILSNRLMPPSWLEGGSTDYLLGTDSLGRDILSRIIYGARVSLLVGVVSVALSLLVGVPLGVVAGYLGSWVDTVIMRLMDIMMALPAILLAIVIVAILGPDLKNAMIAIGVVNVPKYARLARALVISEKQKEYVQASIAEGAGSIRIMFKGILPNTLSPIIVQSTMGFATAVIEAAALSFIGLGAQPPTPEWGAMLTNGKEYFINGWWVMTWPGIAIFVTVLGFNLFGDGLRDALDPRSTK